MLFICSNYFVAEMVIFDLSDLNYLGLVLMLVKELEWGQLKGHFL